MTFTFSTLTALLGTLITVHCPYFWNSLQSLDLVRTELTKTQLIVLSYQDELYFYARQQIYKYFMITNTPTCIMYCHLLNYYICST